MFFKSFIKNQCAQVCDATKYNSITKCRALKKILSLLTILISVSTFAQQTITIAFKNTIGNKILNTDSTYTNQFGETFKVRNCKYYISNIVLIDADNNLSQTFNDQYFLIDEKEEASKNIVLSTSLPHITAIHFLLGVDSIKNVSGVQTGVLDPAKGMFWTWNTGYVMAKLEGTSPAAKTPGHAFSYHVGGYKPGEAVAKKIQLALQRPLMLNTKGKEILITADLLKWFSNKHAIKIADAAFCHEPGKLAMQLADNYAGMFSIESAE
jgi:hypothetical protein